MSLNTTKLFPPLGGPVSAYASANPVLALKTRVHAEDVDTLVDVLEHIVQPTEHRALGVLAKIGEQLNGTFPESFDIVSLSTLAYDFGDVTLWLWGVEVSAASLRSFG